MRIFAFLDTGQYLSDSGCLAGFVRIGLVVTSWQAVAAPAKTPPDVIAKLDDAVVKALRSPDVRERMNQIGFDVVASTPEEFGTFMQDEVTRWTGSSTAAASSPVDRCLGSPR